MMRRTIATIGLFALFLVCGCAAKPPVSENACAGDPGARAAELDVTEVGAFLESALSDGSCWRDAVQGVLNREKPMPRKHLVLAMDEFNANATARIFHLAMDQYLRGLVERRWPYTEGDRRLLEAYSRHTIRTARRQDDEKLQVAQMACARLDRTLYSRLFE